MDNSPVILPVEVQTGGSNAALEGLLARWDLLVKGVGAGVPVYTAFNVVLKGMDDEMVLSTATVRTLEEQIALLNAQVTKVQSLGLALAPETAITGMKALAASMNDVNTSYLDQTTSIKEMRQATTEWNAAQEPMRQSIVAGEAALKEDIATGQTWDGMMQAKIKSTQAVADAETRLAATRQTNLGVMSSQEALQQGLITQEGQVAQGLDEWRTSEEGLAAAQNAGVSAAATQIEAETRIAAVKGDAIGANEALATSDLVLTDAEKARFAAMGITTEMLGIETAATEANTVATDAATLGYGRFHLGALSLGQSLNVLGVGVLAVGYGLVEAVKSAAQWQTAMTQLQNNTSATDETMQQMSSTIRVLAMNTGAEFQGLEDATRRVLDYSFSANDAVTILTETTRAAVATGANEANTAQGVAQALHQYGASANEAANYTNILMRESQLANATLEQFSEQTKTAVGVASEMGVSYAEVTSALAALTRTYGDVSKAQQQVTNIMRYLIAPTQTEAAAWDELARQSGDAMISSEKLGATMGAEGLTGIINRVNAAYKELGFSQQQIDNYTLHLINSQRGGLGLLELLTNANADFKNGMQQAAEVLGGNLDPTTQGFNRTLVTTQSTWDRWVNQIQVGTQRVGEFVTPVFETILRVINGLSLALTQVGIAFKTVHDYIANDESALADDAKAMANLTANMDKFNTMANSSVGGAALTDQQQKLKDLEASYDSITGKTHDWADATNPLNMSLQEGAVAMAQQINTTGELTGHLTPLQEIMVALAYAEGLVTDQTKAAGKAQMEQAQAAETLAQQGKAASAAYALATKDGMAQALQVTKDGVAQLTEQLDTADKWAELMHKAGTAQDAALADAAVANKETLLSEQKDILTILEGLAAQMGVDGAKSGFNWTNGLDSTLRKNMAEIFGLLGTYEQGFNEQDLFSKLGIATGDNWASGVASRVAAWFDPIKKQVQAYITLFSTMGGLLHSISAPLEAMGIKSPVAGLENQIQTMIGDAQSKLAGLTADVSAQVSKATAQHAADVAKKAAGGAGGPSASQAQSSLLQAAQANALAERGIELTKEDTQAKMDLQVQTDKVKDADIAYTASIDALNGAIAANKNAEANDTKLLAAKQAVIDAQAAQDAASVQNAADANTLAISIHQVTDQLKELAAEAVIAEKPLEDTLKADTAAMKELTDATAAQDLVYTRQKEGIAELQYQEQQQEKEVMGPYKAAYAASTLEVEKAQAAVAAISDEYDKKLFPITQKLTKLEQERAQIKTDETLNNEAQSAANLTARLKDLIPGSAEYNAVLKQQATAQKELGLDVQIDQLTKQKNAIEAQKTAALEAAQLQLKAAQAQQKAAKASMDAEQQIFDQQKTNLDEQANNIQHAQTLYDEQQRDKVVAQQKVIDQDTAALQFQKDLDTARAKSDTDYLAQLNNESGELSFKASEDSYNYGLVTTSAKKMVTDLQKPYEDLNSWLSTAVNNVQAQKKAYDDNEAPITNHLQNIATATGDTLKVFNTYKSEVDTAQKWADAQTAFANAMDKTKVGAPIVGGAIKDITANAAPLATATDAATASFVGTGGSGGLNQAVKDTADTITNTLGPSVTDMKNSIDPSLQGVGQEFNKYFGKPSDPGYDEAVNIGWLMSNRNVDGFYGRLVESADLALGLDGLRGMFHNRFTELETDVNGVISDWGPTLFASGGTAADSFADGFFQELQKRMGTYYPGGPPSSTPPSPNPQDNPPPGIAGSSVPLKHVTYIQGTQVHVNVPKSMSGDPNDYAPQVADAIMEALNRRIRVRGLGRAIH